MFYACMYLLYALPTDIGFPAPNRLISLKFEEDPIEKLLSLRCFLLWKDLTSLGEKNLTESNFAAAAALSGI